MIKYTIESLRTEENKILNQFEILLKQANLLSPGDTAESIMKSIIEESAAQTNQDVDSMVQNILSGSNGRDITLKTKQDLRDYISKPYNKDDMRKLVPGEDLNSVMVSLQNNINFALENLDANRIYSAIGSKFENELTIKMMELLNQNSNYNKDLGTYFKDELNGPMKYDFVKGLGEAIKDELIENIEKNRPGNEKLPQGYIYQTKTSKAKGKHMEFKSEPTAITSTIRLYNVGAEKDRVDIKFSIDYETTNPKTQKKKNIMSKGFNMGLDAKKYKSIYNVPKSVSVSEMKDNFLKGKYKDWNIEEINLLFDNNNGFLSNQKAKTKIFNIMMNKTIVSFNTGIPTLFFVVNDKCYRASELWELLEDGGTVLYQRKEHYFWYGKSNK